MPDYPTVVDAISRFDAELVAKSPETRKTYRKALRRFEESLRDHDADPESLATNELPQIVLEDFYLWLIDTYGRDHRTTANDYLAGVRAWVRFLDHHGWLSPEVSYERMKARVNELAGRVSYRTPRVDDSIASVIIYVNGLSVPAATPSNAQIRLALLRDKAMLNTLFSTGLRRTEISRLNRADVADGRQRAALVTGKGDKERLVFFDELALGYVREYLQARADSYLPLFIRHDDGRGKPGPRGERWRLSPQSVWGTVKRYGRLAGVEVTTHHLRHLKARTLLNNGAQLSEVQDLLGHASPDTTKRIYAQYTKQHLEEAFDRYSSSPEELTRRLESD